MKVKMWNTETKEMEFPDFVNCVNGELDRDSYILIRYSGFKDSDKEEIYEGDEIEFAIEGTETSIEIVTGIVEFSDKYGAFVINSKKWKGLLYKKVGQMWLKVIGNIYKGRNK